MEKKIAFYPYFHMENLVGLPDVFGEAPRRKRGDEIH